MNPAAAAEARILAAFDAVHLAHRSLSANLTATFVTARHFLLTGDARLLTPPTLHNLFWGSWLWHPFVAAIGAPDQLEEADRRALALLLTDCTGRVEHLLAGWLKPHLGAERPEQDLFGAATRELEALKADPAVLDTLSLLNSLPLERAGQPNSLGRSFITMEAGAFARFLERINRFQGELIFQLVARVASANLTPYLNGRLSSAGLAEAVDYRWAWLAENGAAPDRALIRRAYDLCEGTSSRWLIGAGLLVRAEAEDSAQLRPEVVAHARNLLASPLDVHPRCDVIDWLLDAASEVAIPELDRFLRRELQPNEEDNLVFARSYLLEKALATLERKARPLLLAALESDELTRLLAADVLRREDDPELEPSIERAIRGGLRGEKRGVVLKWVEVVAAWHFPRVADALWPLLEHASKPIRDAAADALGKLPAVDAVPRAGALLTARKSAVRAAAVRLLGHFAGNPAAREALHARREAEDDEGVREAIMQVLGTGAEAADADPAGGRAAVEKLVARDAGRLKGTPVAWLDENGLPPLFYQGEDTPVPAATVRWLLHRQARHKDISAAAEARPLLDALDRARAGDFARHVLQGFLGSTPQEARDRWALAVAGLLGDGRTLRALTKQIPEWAESSRGKLAEYATGAIALLGTDEALLALDALSIRYRSRFKNIGAAATAAFVAAAEARGLTTDELGDRVVPTLGFPPDGAPRVVDVGGDGRRVEVRVGLDFKLELADAATHRKVAAWPSTTPAEVRAEMKEVAAALREAAKAQTLRMETQLVRQRRWPAARWRELFLGSALLRPFAVRLVWGEYGADGVLRATFRALPDGALTDAEDNTPEPPADPATVGPVHPLELDATTLTAWRTHLEDYAVEPPFAQLERPVARVSAELATARFHPGGTATGTAATVGALTFKSRAEKRGWTRGSVNDGGGVWHYVKRFPGAGVDVFLETGGLFIGAGMDDQVEPGRLFFVRADSVRTGGYTYDEPQDENDPRLVALGEVPPVAFSEAVGDLKTILGAGLASTE